jgi:hypothetical protein
VLAAGSPVTIHQDVLGAPRQSFLLDVEIYDLSGQKVAQTVVEDQTLGDDGSGQYSVAVPVPAAVASGQYQVKVGAFTSGWASMLAWNDDAARIMIEPAVAASTAP